MPTSGKLERERLALEVLELGETLVDSLIEAATNPGHDSCPAEDWGEAADQFFTALRLLLADQLEGPSK